MASRRTIAINAPNVEMMNPVAGGKCLFGKMLHTQFGSKRRLALLSMENLLCRKNTTFVASGTHPPEVPIDGFGKTTLDRRKKGAGNHEWTPVLPLSREPCCPTDGPVRFPLA
ncbi:hypothetical protein RSSM_00054 [Rhodopirellula sallentina SM41]|uniref:Uncharacterized protein n=1 Tax=Rhodopirellula sallentina SM41 TaxID=1263870 RepID=M5UAR7_9BACT|nr:hypothetical protein RSSM_00054 [Rhodopirellula sallentina SM41]